MKAVFLTEPKKLEIRDIPIPEYKSDEVLIQIKETGLCGSDLHYYKDGKVGDHIVTEPHILGHESSGVVVETGSAVTNLKKGDWVSIEPGLPCLHCEHCLSGRYNLCESVIFFGVPPFQGTFREFVSHKADFTHKHVLDILNGHAQNLLKMVTHRFNLSELPKAVDTALDPKINRMKIVIES